MRQRVPIIRLLYKKLIVEFLCFTGRAQSVEYNNLKQLFAVPEIDAYFTRLSRTAMYI